MINTLRVLFNLLESYGSQSCATDETALYLYSQIDMSKMTNICIAADEMCVPILQEHLTQDLPRFQLIDFNPQDYDDHKELRIQIYNERYTLNLYPYSIIGNDNYFGRCADIPCVIESESFIRVIGKALSSPTVTATDYLRIIMNVLQWTENDICINQAELLNVLVHAKKFNANDFPAELFNIFKNIMSNDYGLILPDWMHY